MHNGDLFLPILQCSIFKSELYRHEYGICQKLKRRQPNCTNSILWHFLSSDLLDQIETHFLPWVARPTYLNNASENMPKTYFLACLIAEHIYNPKSQFKF